MFAENYFDVITGGYECVYNFHPFVYILLCFVNASVVRDTFWTAKYDKGMTTWSYLSIVTQAMVLHIHNVGNYHQFTKVVRHYSGGNLRSLLFDFSKRRLRGSETRDRDDEAKINLVLLHLIIALWKIILPRKFRNESSDMKEGTSVANNKDFIYYSFIFVYWLRSTSSSTGC